MNDSFATGSSMVYSISKSSSDPSGPPGTQGTTGYRPSKHPRKVTKGAFGGKSKNKP